MNKQLESVRFTINHKYENYKILLKKIDIEDPHTDKLVALSARMQVKFNDILEYKDILINSKNLSSTFRIDKLDLYMSLKVLSNLNTKYSIDGINLLYGGESKDLNNIIDLYINKIAHNIKDGVVDIDDIVAIFKIVDFKIDIHRNPELEFKIKSFKNENLDESMKSFIYGQGFEQLNLIFLNKSLGLNLRKIETLEDWNDISSLKQYNLWKRKTQDNNITYNEWINDERLSKDNFKIPSMDLVDLNDNLDVFIETKNYSVNKNSSININFKYDPSYLLTRMSNQEKLAKDNTKLLYNINLYDQKANDSSHYNIPIHDMKKFYKKIDNRIQQELKSNSRNTNSSKKMKFKIEVTDGAEVGVFFDVNRKNEIVENSFKLFMNKDGFENLFKQHQIDINDNNLIHIN